MTAPKPTRMEVFLRKLETFLKGYLSTILALYMADPTLFNGGWETWKAIFISALTSNIPIIYNWLNPKYTGYGRKAK